MCFNYSALNGKIKEKYHNQYAFAYDMKMSERTLSLKLNNKRGWKQSEMFKACELLDIPLEDMPIYFFAYEVQKN